MNIPPLNNHNRIGTVNVVNASSNDNRRGCSLSIRASKRQNAMNAKKMIIIGVAASSLTLFAHEARAKTKNPPKSSINKAGDLFQLDVKEFGKIFTQEFGVSTAVGVGVGYAIKSTVKVACLGVASFFALLRWLEMNDLIDVKWKNVEKFVQKGSLVADLNKDGKVDLNDVQYAKVKAVGFFETALPSAGGLMSGIALGLKL